MFRGHNSTVRWLAAFGLILMCSGALACNQDSPKFETWAPVLPEQATQGTGCIDGEWCWIHPSPSPYTIRDLKPVDKEVHAVGRISEIQPWQPAVLGEGVELIDIPVPKLRSEDVTQEKRDANTLQYLTANRNGWLGVTAGQTVYEFGPDGTVDSLLLPATVGQWEHIYGASLDSFLVENYSGTAAFVRRDGSLTRYRDLIGYESRDSHSVRMWADGTIWEIGAQNPEAQRFDLAYWKGFPAPRVDGESSLGIYGPGPDSACADQGIWAWGHGDLQRWNPSTESWRAIDYDGGLPTAIGCDHLGNIAVTDNEGRLHRLRSDGWTSVKVDDRALMDVAPVETPSGPTTFVTGADGMFAKISDGEVEVLTGGFRLPANLAGRNTRSDTFIDLWMSDDGKRGVFLHETGFYHGEGDRWRSVPNEIPEESYLRNHDEIWGVTRPEFAILEGQLMRWTGSQWVQSELGVFKESGRYRGPKDLAGESPDAVWMVHGRGIERYNGDAWSTVISNEDLRLFEMLFSEDGDHLVAGVGRLYRLESVRGGWQLVSTEGHPCGRVEDLYRAEDGTLYVAGREGCISWRTDGEWTYSNIEGRKGAFKPRTTSKQFVEQPGAEVPLVATHVGLLEPQEDGSLQTVLNGTLTDAMYLPERNVTIVLNQHGAMANYHSRDGN